MELDKKLKVEALLAIHPINSKQEIDGLISKVNRTIFVSGHRQVSLIPGRVKEITDETIDKWDIFFVEKEKREEKDRQKIDKSFTKVYQKIDKGNSKVGTVLDIIVKDNLSPPAQDTPPVVSEAPTEMQNENEKISEEVKTNNVDSKSDILFTMNVDTQDINNVLDKEIAEEKKFEALNVEKLESPVKTIDTQQNIEIPVGIEKEQEQKQSEPKVNKNEDKSENKEEKVDKEEVKVSGEEKKVIVEPSTPPSTSTMDYKPTNVTDVLLDSIKKITECNALTFKAIDDSLPILQMIAPACKVDHIVGSIGKLDTLSKFISSNIQTIDKINEETIKERVNKEKDEFFDKTIKDCTGQIDSLLLALNSTILEYKELYREACKPHHLIEDIDEKIKKTQK